MYSNLSWFQKIFWKAISIRLRKKPFFKVEKVEVFDVDNVVETGNYWYASDDDKQYIVARMEWITEVLHTLDIHVVDFMNTKVIIVDSAVSNNESVESMSNNESGLARSFITAAGDETSCCW